jgi:hypothetical protein
MYLPTGQSFVPENVGLSGQDITINNTRKHSAMTLYWTWVYQVEQFLTLKGTRNDKL